MTDDKNIENIGSEASSRLNDLEGSGESKSETTSHKQEKITLKHLDQTASPLESFLGFDIYRSHKCIYLLYLACWGLIVIPFARMRYAKINSDRIWKKNIDENLEIIASFFGEESLK
jgi:hypothetical protein